MKTKKSASKKFLSLSPAERDREVAKFDREIDLERDTKPLSPSQKAKFERWQRKTPQREVTIKLDAVTLDRCRAYAERHQLSLSDVVNLGLASVFQFAE